MRKTLFASTLLTAFAIAPSTHAADFDAAESAFDTIATRLFSERNVDLLFGLLRQSLTAAANGETPPAPPAEVTAQFEAAGKALQREAGAAAALFLEEAQREMQRALREESPQSTW